MKLLTLLLLVAAPLAALAAPLTNEDIIRLTTDEGFSAETAVIYIETQEAAFDLSPAGLTRLKDAGVPEPVIRAMLKKGQASSATPSEERDEFDRPNAPPRVRPNQPAASSGTPDASQVVPPTVDIQQGETYYLRFNLKYERSKWPVTNYWRGTLLPINTQVRVIGLDGDSMSLDIPSHGTSLKVENISKYSGGDMYAYARKMLSAEPTKLELYDDSLRQSILSGEPRRGMTKEQVVMTRGIPPKHKTPSLESSRWTYWSSRFVTRTLVFQNNLLVEGRGI